MKKLIIICLLLTFGQGHAQDLFQESLYSADLVMMHQDKIKLSDQQRERIKKYQYQNAKDFNLLKKDLERATSKLKEMLNERNLHQGEVQIQMDKVLALENSLKQKQLATLIAIKNVLNASQQDALKKLKAASRPLNGVASVSRSNGTAGNGVAMTIHNGNSVDQPSFYISSKSGLIKIKDVSTISPDDIKAIEVLKGDTAVERMGNEGKNGVIIITLKDGAQYDLKNSK
ncbi:TonB-dependent receptor plug domain-containing protein [Anditalea andensis]|uniref:TonB-dependent receptor plug domain-containing protein n=1 Tax=Anditalea andensis TaxID=1048983 RepID=A0A074LDA3_9BACT|nr:TonB-dependent receptor plug domain-containing protein [Anditalea andensis]KEO71767.1 hypothetical protein EL17_21520 [Anditalea andensis]